MPFFIISVLIQGCFVIHVVKTGRNTTWIWIIVMLPFAGSIAYLVLEILPQVAQFRCGSRAKRKVSAIINPKKDLNQAAQQYSAADTVENSIKLAEECFEKGLFEWARNLFDKSLSGIYREDPDMLFGFARCEFAFKRFESSKQTLDRLIREKPEYKNQHAHLVYARTLEVLGRRNFC